MSVSFGPGINSYINVDSIIDFLLSINMRPILELSFMPEWLASGNKTVCHYKGIVTPPSDLELWHNMIFELASHISDRYGETAQEFLFEVWNEPGSSHGFWTGSEQDYYDLYNATATAIKRVDPNLRVGGPATDYCTCWITDFIKYCQDNHVPYDFVSTHCYSGGQTNVGNITPVVTGLSQARSLIDNVSVPHVVTEWSSSFVQGSGRGPSVADYHDEPAEAAFFLAAMDQIRTNLTTLPEVLSWWAFSDIFEEPGFAVANSSFHGGFGLLNVYQVPKPTYRAFELLHATATERYVAMVNGTGLCQSSVGVIAARNASNSAQLLVYLYNHQPYEAPAQDCTVQLALPTGFPSLSQQARIDQGHANPKQAWIDMGMPQYPTVAEIESMKQASVLHWESISGTDDAVFTVPKNSVLALRSD
eukprot:m.42516 g.42516  ORF g.42516 m.42516 type:complete len:419 (+) comp12885_c0_seq3:240-1496(+)